MLQAANTDLFNPLVPKAQTSECQNLLFPLQSVIAKLQIFLFLHPRLGTNGLIVPFCRIIIMLYICPSCRLCLSWFSFSTV